MKFFLKVKYIVAICTLTLLMNSCIGVGIPDYEIPDICEDCSETSIVLNLSAEDNPDCPSIGIGYTEVEQSFNFGGYSLVTLLGSSRLTSCMYLFGVDLVIRVREVICTTEIITGNRTPFPAECEQEVHVPPVPCNKKEQVYVKLQCTLY
jgi:hypothetical protein